MCSLACLLEAMRAALGTAYCAKQAHANFKDAQACGASSIKLQAGCIRPFQGTALQVQERSKTGRIPHKLKLSCKQGGREQQTRSYTLPFPPTAISQLRATALGSVDPALTQSSAVHTLIPNLAPRSRLQHQGPAVSSGTGSNLDAFDMPAKVSGHSSGMQLPGSADFVMESALHKASRQAIFQAAMSLLKPKIAEPVLVNFMSVAGMPVCLCA